MAVHKVKEKYIYLAAVIHTQQIALVQNTAMFLDSNTVTFAFSILSWIKTILCLTGTGLKKKNAASFIGFLTQTKPKEWNHK